MRSSVLGWVLNIRAMPALLDRASASGLWMYIDACAGCTAIGRCSAMASMRRSALASGAPVPSSSAAPRSASNSRDRDTAIWISDAAMGARIAAASIINGLPLRSRRPPNIDE